MSELDYDTWLSLCAGGNHQERTMSETEWRAAVEQMLAWEKEGGDGWWKGFEMLKAAYAAPAPPAQGELEAALQACHNWLRKNANAESKLCREQLNRRTDKLDAFVEAHNAIAEISEKQAMKDA